jgi:signal transduction histidine kinase
VERQGPDDASPRLSKLLRHLTEAAERDAAARERLATAVARVLDLPAGGDLGALLTAMTSASPAVDAAAVLVVEAGEWRVAASLGLDAAPGPLDPSLLSDEPLKAAASARRQAVAASGGARAGPLPAGTRAACATPMLSLQGDLVGLVVLGSRSAHDLGPEEQLVARIVAERAARAVDGAAMQAELARAQQLVKRTSGFRDQVLAIVGHDLRNPLGAIVMSTVLLHRKGELEGWQARTVDRVRSSALRMGRIINDLLSYTRTRLGDGIPITPRATDLGELARRMVDELRAAHPECVVQLSADGDLAGEWDADRLEQVLSNLVSNAIDHGVDGEPIDVALRGDGDAVTVAVVNRGEMPSAVLEHAFEAFHRGPEQTGKKASGLGLGLYIAREIVRRHGGEIGIRSAEGATSVDMRIPRHTTAGQPASTAG